MEDTLKKKEVRDQVKEGYSPFAGIEQLPKEKSGLKGWQIALIAVGGVAFVAIVAGAIIFAKKKSQNSISTNPWKKNKYNIKETKFF